MSDASDSRPFRGLCWARVSPCLRPLHSLHGPSVPSGREPGRASGVSLSVRHLLARVSLRHPPQPRIPARKRPVGPATHLIPLAFAASLTRVFGSLTRNRPTSHTPHHSLAWLGLSSFCVSSPRLTRYSVRASLSLLALLVVPKGRSLPTGFALTLPQPLGTRVTHPLSSRYTSLGSATRFVLRVSLHGPSGPRFTRRSLSLVAPFLATLVLRPSGPRSLVTKGV